MMKRSSVTQFIKYDPKNNVKHFPECDDIKEINYYVFATKTGPFTKNDKNTEYSRTAPVDKKDKICDIVEKLLIFLFIIKWNSVQAEFMKNDQIKKVFRYLVIVFFNFTVYDIIYIKKKKKDKWLNIFLNIYRIQKQYTIENIYVNLESVYLNFSCCLEE